MSQQHGGTSLDSAPVLNQLPNNKLHRLRRGRIGWGTNFAHPHFMAADNAGREPETFRLGGSVTLAVLYPVLNRIWAAARSTPGASFHIDCTAVTEFSIQALVELTTLRRDVRAQGGDLFLIQVSPELYQKWSDPRFKQLIDQGGLTKLEKSGVSGPHQPHLPKWKHAKRPAKKRREPYFLSLRGTRYQRFWLN